MSLFDETPPPPLAEVVTLHPDGVFLRVEVRSGIEFFWLERRRGTSSTAAVVHDLEELKQAHTVIARELAKRGLL